ncbi:NTP/NDP exchange transporter [Tahibacter soli]|uniref:MFS transporter n=1 Tax=Tahibacter soli TaxID=2983605 RepID=A0A9X4BIM4_9GAMM|nr:MFS transporter [Tahibacter soli]MDC8011264.1 MFS transporter [Tahibacter soli]
MPKRIAVERHEWPALVVSFSYFFLVLAAYYMVRPVRDQLSAAVGSTALPMFYLVTFVVTLSLTPLFGALASRFPRRQFVPAVYLFFLACLLGFIPLFEMQDQIGAKLLGTIFFVWVSVFNLFVVAVFWSFIADIFDPQQARRLFPVIAVGGALGAIAGPLVTKGLVYEVGVSGLLVLSASLLGLCIACIFSLSAWARRNPVASEPDRDARIIGGSMIGGVVQTLRSPFLRRVALLLLLGDAVGTVIYAMLSDYSNATFTTREERIAFASNVDLYANVLQIALQVTLTRELLMRFGPSAAIIVDGLIKAVMLVGLIVFGAGWIVVVAVITRASAYGVFKPGADSLYTMVDAETRYKAKNFIDTAVWRFGDLVVTSGFNLLRAVGVTLPGFALLTVAAALTSAWQGWRVAQSDELTGKPDEKAAA